MYITTSLLNNLIKTQMGQNCTARCSCLHRDNELDHVVDVVLYRRDFHAKTYKNSIADKNTFRLHQQSHKTPISSLISRKVSLKMERKPRSSTNTPRHPRIIPHVRKLVITWRNTQNSRVKS